MELANCIAQASYQAVTDNTPMIIVHDPIANAEEDGDYGYCPAEGRAKELLFRHGTITHRITTNGAVIEEK